MNFGTATPHIACYVLLKKENKILFILRSNTGWMDGKYGLAAGKVEKGETFLQGAIREAKEEAGVVIEERDLEQILTIHRKADSDDNTWVDIFFETEKWRGRPYNAEPHMHTSVDWLDPKKLPENVIPMIKFALEQIASGTKYAQFGWD